MSERIPVITVTGDAHAVGHAHAEQTMELRDGVAENVARVASSYPPARIATQMDEVATVLEMHSPDTLGQLHGMAEVYDLSTRDMLAAVLQTYLDGMRRSETSQDQGCSTYAYAGPAGEVLVKNRDTNVRFRAAQTIVQVAGGGYAWTALSTAGAPGVHSAGMNEHGLSVADTHVPSRDSGPGLPRFSMMMNILQRCRSVAESVRYLYDTPGMGYGNLIMLDEGGVHVVVEFGHAASGAIAGDAPYRVATNHFETDTMRSTGLEPADSRAGRDSRMRKSTVARRVAQLADAVLADPMEPMRHHEPDGLGSVCVHADEGSATISTIVMKPRERLFGVAWGNPCESELHLYSASPREWSRNER